ncbi:fumarylacetoacetate hydrolase family protein [Ferrovibrio sp.]|jgi:2-keto-4-pentenoate hydratase/2-oxohepta-3-ene-1,7-dioic acid hydratase in catechol pathway|uniref:fumarylacetoacetate hydrolase family protein n=1 Tax=Ferrovibrio sp. TaxID=1917215 RepID=UPI0035B36B4F
MKLASFTYQGRESWGAVQGDRIVDLGRHFGGKYPALADFIASADFAGRDRIVQGLAADIPVSAISFLPVIPRPEKIVCLVRNYMDHHQEVLAAGMHRELSEFPPIFLRVWRSQVGHGQPIIRPKVSEQLDWEGEMALIIGKGGRHIAPADAYSHIAGYACYNDASIREWQFHAKQIAAGKNFVGTGAFGPWMVTADEIPEPENLKLELRLNGKTEQSSNTSNLIFKIPTIINYCSTIFDLVPGDVIVTGTPAGVGWSRKPPHFMKHGDVVEVEIEKIGILRNPVVNEA